MKLIQKISFFFLLVATMTGCERDYDAPPLSEPIYKGEKANITLAQLKENCKAATEDTPIVITDNWIVKAYITGNDESGNIYKQIIVQDNTGALPIQVDEGSVYATYRRGQEVFINLKGMCVSVYGDEQQLGAPEAYLYRMPFTEFKERVQKNGWPYVTNVEPEILTDISKANLDVARMTYRLVQLEGVTFENGGKNTFAAKDGYGQETLTDAHGNTVTVRTSNYASFAFETLPVGKGTVVGILGRFRGAWQLTIPTYADVFGFDGIEPGEGGGEGGDTEDTVLFGETFKEPQKVNEKWVTITEWWKASSSNTFDNPSSMFSGSLDVLSPRTQGGDGSIWFPAGGDYSLTIGSIDTKGADKVTLVYKMFPNVYQDTEVQNINTLSIKVNDVVLEVPSKEMTGSKNPNLQEEIRIENISVSGNVSLTFSVENATNVKGVRLYDVKLIAPGTGEGGGEVITPVPDAK